MTTAASNQPVTNPPSPVLSVCVLSYNGEAVLERCLASLGAARSRLDLPTEVLVTDNGSRDGTFAMVGAKFPWVRLFRYERNQFFTRPFNRMYAEALGRYVLITNNDVEFEDPQTLSGLVRYLETHPRCGAVAPKSVNPDGTVELICKPAPSFELLVKEWTFLGFFGLARGKGAHRLDPTKPQQVEVAQDSSLLVRKEAAGEGPLYDTSFQLYYTEDELCGRLRSRGWTIDYEPSLWVKHIGHYTTRRENPLRVKRGYVADMLTYSTKYLGAWRTNLFLRPLTYCTLALQMPRWAVKKVLRA